MSFSWSDARDRQELMTVLPHAWSRRDKLRGASTITQQLAKNLYLSASRNPLRKVKEAVITWRLEAALNKPRIMELYLNIAELGRGVWGVEAASRLYFGRSAGELSREQATALAGALPFPRSSNPGYRPGRMRWRQNLILRRMMGEQVEVPQVETEIEPIRVDSLDVTPSADSTPEADTLPWAEEPPVPEVDTISPLPESLPSAGL
jgi:monofunctional biosynthetic peptidoglycan transglycosylase